MTLMHLMMQMLRCCQKQAAGRRVHRLTSVTVILTVICGYYVMQTRNSHDEKTPNNLIDNNHNVVPDNDVDEAAADFAQDPFISSQQNDKQQRSVQQKKNATANVYFKGGEKAQNDNKDVKYSHRELRNLATGNAARDRNLRHHKDRVADDVQPHPRSRAMDDDHEHDDDDEPNKNGDKDASKDTENDDEVGNKNADEKKHEEESAVEVNKIGKFYNTCDSECRRFRAELAAWPAHKPKAFIYYLIHRPALPSLRRSIRALHHNFNRRYRYPIVVFVEPELDTVTDRRNIADMIPTDDSESLLRPSIYVQVVRFRIPAHVNASLVPRKAGFGSRKRTIGYRHMCRFHAGGVYTQPLVRSAGLQYGWRLDDDSIIRRPINYDVFEVMRRGGYQYGYRRVNTGWSPVDCALWDAVDRYLNSTPTLTPTFYHHWPRNAARYFNNFEVSDLRVWMSAEYRDYFNFVDRLGGIYYHKWGDAAIKTIAVTLFIPRHQTHKFTGIVYSHI